MWDDKYEKTNEIIDKETKINLDRGFSVFREQGRYFGRINNGYIVIICGEEGHK